MFNIAAVQEAVAEVIPDREALVFRDKRFTYQQLTLRTRQLANYLIGRGVGINTARQDLVNWESGQDHVALYLYNGNEYLEGMLGSYKARLAPFNVNYRYVEEELVYLLNNAQSKVLIYHAEFAPRVAAVRSQVPSLEIFIQVADDSGNTLLEGAVDYETVLQNSSSERPELSLSAEDLYILYTGGTTGMPKGVLWRQGDILIAALGGRDAQTGAIIDSLETYQQRALANGTKVMPAPPLMHGAAHWVALSAWCAGNTVVMQSTVERLDCDDVWGICEQEKVNMLLIVGDAYGRPLADRLKDKQYDLSNLAAIISGGAALNASIKQEFLGLLPNTMIIDAIGSSETGGQGSHISTKDGAASTGKFTPNADNIVVNETMTEVLAPGHEGMGWWAKRGYVPLGYLGDEAKSNKTFLTIASKRYSIPGDRAKHLADGSIELHGRDSATINSGGEKIFAEEVEHALKQHPAVYDSVVAGRTSQRWGQEVVAIVQLRHAVDDASLLAECEKHLARYKFPKLFIRVEKVQRSPSGKADYRWAKEIATQG